MVSDGLNIDVTPAELPHALMACYKAGLTPALWGPPGVGKSEVVHQFAEMLRRALGNPETWFYREVRGSTMDPTDLSGLPFPVGDRTVYLKQEWYPRSGPGVFFMDEYPQMSTAVMCASTQLLDRTGGGADFPKDVMIVIAGNRTEDGAAANRIPTHIRNRLVHINIMFSVEAWGDWNMANGTRPEVVAFGKFRPDLFAAEVPKDGKPFLTGRSLTRCSRILEIAEDLPPGLDMKLYAGLIGTGNAIELMGFLKVAGKTVPPATIIADPEGAPIPSSKDAMLATVAGLAFLADWGNFERVIRYALRLAPEDSVALVVGALKKDNSQRQRADKPGKPLAAHESAAFTAWTVKYSDVILG